MLGKGDKQAQLAQGGEATSSWTPSLPHVGGVSTVAQHGMQPASCLLGDGGSSRNEGGEASGLDTAADDMSLAGLTLASGDSMQYSVDSG